MMNHQHQQHHHEMRRSRPKSQVMTLDTSSPPPPPQRKNGSLPQQQRWYENDGELKERQLQELKTRMRQMEKTMRWWSDCATNWREKWSQLRLERNHVKEDLKTTQTDLERVCKELEFYKGRSALCTPTPTTPNANGRSSELNSVHSGGSGAKNKRIQTDPVDYLKSDEVIRLEKSVARYLLMLEEANRTIIAEREDKIILHHTVERLQRDLQDLQELYDNLKKEMYELKDFSEMDESYCGERGDAIGIDHDQFQDQDQDLDGDGGCGLSDDEVEVNGAVGFTAAAAGHGLGFGLGIENEKLSPLNYQTSLFVDLSERRVNEVSSMSPPILQIVEDSDMCVRDPDQEITTVVSVSVCRPDDVVSPGLDPDQSSLHPECEREPKEVIHLGICVSDKDKESSPTTCGPDPGNRDQDQLELETKLASCSVVIEDQQKQDQNHDIVKEQEREDQDQGHANANAAVEEISK